MAVHVSFIGTHLQQHWLTVHLVLAWRDTALCLLATPAATVAFVVVFQACQNPAVSSKFRHDSHA